MSRSAAFLPLVLVAYLLLVPTLLAARVWLHHDTAIAVHDGAPAHGITHVVYDS